jgi:tripeptidyl-peptidase I
MLIFFSLFLLHGYLINGHDVITESISKTEGSPKSLPVSAFAFRESIARLSTRNDLFRQQRMHHDHVHEVTFVIQQRNMELLTAVLHDVSNPLSENYGQHMTKDEVTTMTSNPEAHKAVTDYLLTVGAIINPEDVGIDYIRASASIAVWEKTFDTHFFEFHQIQLNGNTEKFVRAEKYSILMVLDSHVQSVFNTIQMPYRLSGSLPKLTTPPAVTNAKGALVDPTATMTTPAKLKQFYNLTTQGSYNSTQCVYATINQYFSPSDLDLFQKTFGLQSKAVAGSIGGHSSNAGCVKNSDSCAEGNLDVQYMMAVSPDSPTTYWYSDLDFSAWLVTVAALSKPPLVLSISYGAEEDSVSTSELDAFNTEAIKLGSMGVSIVLASGDDGALSDNVRQSGQSACGYTPIFPASCPYVVAVGGTAVSLSLIEVELLFSQFNASVDISFS